MKRALLIVSLAACVAGLQVAMAQDAKKARSSLSLEQLLAALDKNGDGRIALDEVPEMRQPFFQRLLGQLDGNGDNILDKEELANYQGASNGGQKSPPSDAPAAAGGASPAAEAILVAIDKDGDGKLSKDEIAGATAALAALDQDKDGELAADELAAAPKKAAGAGGGSKQVQNYIAMKDKNQDGKLDADELPASIAEAINQYDNDGDERLDPNELNNALQALLANRKKK